MSMVPQSNPLLRYHGGKFKMADWIISHFSSHHTYVEPYGGGAAVLLSKLPSEIEVYNDIDEDIVNFFAVLRDPELANQLVQLLALTPYSRVEFLAAKKPHHCAVEKARRLVIRAQMGFGSTGATKPNTGFRLDTARTGSDIVTIWNRQPDLIRKAAERFKQVLIEKRPALTVIENHDRDDTLFYIDPPYVQDTRKMCGDVYRYEMDDAQHEQLLIKLQTVKGKVILSGYDHPIYESYLGHWQKKERSVAASGRLGSKAQTECLWINPQAQFHDLFSQ